MSVPYSAGPTRSRHTTLTLSDGRSLSYADYGAERDPLVVFIPGFGHSRLARAPGGCPGIRVISIDLPGIGNSTANTGYSLQSWALDIDQLLDGLGVPRCAALGWSWGGPYALALGHVLPDRITAVGLASALTGWLTGPGRAREVKAEFRTFGLWWYTPFAARQFLRRQARAVLADPEKAYAKDYHVAPEADRNVMDDPQLRQMLLDSQREAWIHGTTGMYQHSRAVALPWGFDPAAVKAPLHMWQGEADPEIRAAMAAAFAHRSNADLQVSPNGGHLLVFSQWEQILAQLTGHEDQSRTDTP